MRSYRQYCALAKALDVIGDRWSLLIVRELKLSGPARYTDLRNGLPGIASNLLADRMRELERAGVVTREDAPPPIATTLFHLTPRGEALYPAMVELARWGAPLLAGAPPDDEFRSHWLGFPFSHMLSDQAPDQPPVTIELRTGDRPLLLQTVGDGTVSTRPGTVPHPDAILTGDPRLVLSLIAGRVTLDEAVARGALYQGDPATLRRVQAAQTLNPSARS
jgi:DNA-binding HxlR family transcriptional regulator